MMRSAGSTFPPGFYRTAAVASWLSAITTCCLIFLPEIFASGEGFEARMARVNDPAYQMRAWVYFVHPFLTVTAALGVAMHLRRVAPAWVLPGFLCFLLWGATEAGQQALTLAAFDPWRHAYLAGDEAVRSTMALRTAIYDELWDAMYLLLLVAFLIGNVLYAVATWRGALLAKALSIGYAGAAVLTAFIISSEVGGPGLPESVGFWVYPAIQPLARTLIGVWLWRNARGESFPRGAAAGHANDRSSTV